jgi:NADPH:quinone reductase-like Zn-dependent oxidoreductase
VNYADTHRTEGSYRGGTELPFIPGVEVVGRTPGGRRMLAPICAGGGYAEAAIVPAARAVDVPDDVEDGEALALLVQGLTAWHVLRNSARLAPGQSVVVNAAAGGVGWEQPNGGRVLAPAGDGISPRLPRTTHRAPGLTATGKLHPLVGGNYSLGDARRAHEDLLARSTTGKLVLRP